MSVPGGASSLPLTSEQLHANAVRFLIEGEEYEAANVLLACALTIDASEETGFDSEGLNVRLVGPRAAYEALDRRGAHYGAISNALGTVMPFGHHLDRIIRRVELVKDVDPGWREELREIVKAKGASNQGRVSTPTTVLKAWKNLWFRSESEIRVAQALDRAGALFFPNCLGRVTAGSDRATKEPDFLVCHHGRWGILEVDGEPFHPPSRTVHDHERDRLFKAHGIRVIEHYDAQRCYETPERVVAEFLQIIAAA